MPFIEIAKYQTCRPGASRLWWATKNEWLGLIDVAGLQLEALDGDFEGGALTEHSREYVFVAGRP